MRVIRQARLGGPEVLEVAETAKPEPLPTEIQVRVRAAGVNPADWKTRQEGAFLGAPPFVLGWDVAGVVTELGLGTSLYRVGDEVLGMPRFPGEAAAYAEYVTAPARQFVRKPAGMSFAEAAGLPLAGLTAWQALVDIGNVQAGQRVLIQAAAGGVGHLAVQIAVARGAHVIGTASAPKHDFLRSLGVAEAIDYRTTDIATTVRDIDLALDPVDGHSALVSSLPTVRPGGLLIPVSPVVPDELAAAAVERDVRTSPILVEPDHAGLLALVELVEAGKLRVHVERTFPLAEAGKAHQEGETGRTTGKLVLTVG